MTAFLIGEDIEQADLEALAQNGNTCLGGAGGPLCWVASTFAAGTSAVLELPAYPSLRRMRVLWYTHQAALNATDANITVSDDNGTYGTVSSISLPTPADYTNGGWEDIEPGVATDGRVTVDIGNGGGVAQDVDISCMIVPLPPSTPVSGMGADGYVHDDQTAEDRGASVGLVNKMFGQLWTAWTRPQVYRTFVSGAGERFSAGNSTFLISLPVYSRGHKLGMSIQAADAGAAEVSCSIDGETMTATGFPATQGTITRAQTTNAIRPGNFVADIHVKATAAFDLYSFSLYEAIA